MSVPDSTPLEDLGIWVGEAPGATHWFIPKRIITHEGHEYRATGTPELQWNEKGFWLRLPLSPKGEKPVSRIHLTQRGLRADVFHKFRRGWPYQTGWRIPKAPTTIAAIPAPGQGYTKPSIWQVRYAGQPLSGDGILPPLRPASTRYSTTIRSTVV